MKKLIFAFLTIGAASFFFSCGADDPCQEIECNTGTCDLGICSCIGNFTGTNCDTCIDGYEGADCQILIRDKFIGDYILIDQTCTFGNLANDLEISMVPDPNNILEVSFTLGNAPNPVIFIGTISGNDLSVEVDNNMGSATNIYLTWQTNQNLVGNIQLQLSAAGIDTNCDVVFEPK